AKWHEAQPAPRAGLALQIRVEDVPLLLLRNSRSRIRHRQENDRAAAKCAQRDCPALRRKLDRVAKQIRKHLKNAPSVALDLREKVIRRGLQADRFCLG